MENNMSEYKKVERELNHTEKFLGAKRLQGLKKESIEIDQDHLNRVLKTIVTECESCIGNDINKLILELYQSGNYEKVIELYLEESEGIYVSSKTTYIFIKALVFSKRYREAFAMAFDLVEKFDETLSQDMVDWLQEYLSDPKKYDDYIWDCYYFACQTENYNDYLRVLRAFEKVETENVSSRTLYVCVRALIKMFEQNNAFNYKQGAFRIASDLVENYDETLNREMLSSLCLFLSDCYVDGEVVERDLDKALSYLKEFAYQGISDVIMKQIVCDWLDE